jgi:hypothetical protein
MKNFITYLTESQKTYEFRIKFANIDPNENLEQLKTVLEAYALESLSTPKRLPIQESDIDFPSMRNCQVYLMDAVLKYPCNDAQLRAIIAERAGVPQANLFVVPKNHPEEQRRWNQDGTSDIHEYKQGEAVLDKPYQDNPEAKKAGDSYAKAESLLKELSEPKAVAEGTENNPEGNKGKTTNELPQGTKSPVGSNQNKIPKAKK